MAKRRYPYGKEELERRIDGYFAALENDPTRRGGPSELLSALELDMPTAIQMAQESAGPYRRYGRLMRRAATRLRAHLETSPAWAGSNGTKSVFLIKQPLWDGLCYADRREPAAGDVRVVFGPGPDGGEAFG